MTYHNGDIYEVYLLNLGFMGLEFKAWFWCNDT